MTDFQDIQTIVVGVDGSAASAAAARWAAAEANRRDARLHAVHVIEGGPNGPVTSEREFSMELDEARRTVPGRVCGWLFRAGIEVDLAVSVVTGDLTAQLAREADDASLVVVGSPDSFRHCDLPNDLAQRCLCPVVVVGLFGDARYVDLPAHPSARGASRPRA